MRQDGNGRCDHLAEINDSDPLIQGGSQDF
jgi:hypothetical protein